ncbi:hypothetical protein EDC96DRAFT_540137 [Choanephora cucurbitarum]|nr:hypothetical protein EDC96DRAFT_540137 [Choanephora cucurbitarum]
MPSDFARISARGGNNFKNRVLSFYDLIVYIHLHKRTVPTSRQVKQRRFSHFLLKLSCVIGRYLIFHFHLLLFSRTLMHTNFICQNQGFNYSGSCIYSKFVLHYFETRFPSNKGLINLFLE